MTRLLSSDRLLWGHSQAASYPLPYFILKMTHLTDTETEAQRGEIKLVRETPTQTPLFL